MNILLAIILGLLAVGYYTGYLIFTERTIGLIYMWLALLMATKRDK